MKSKLFAVCLGLLLLFLRPPSRSRGRSGDLSLTQLTLGITVPEALATQSATHLPVASMDHFTHTLHYPYTTLQLSYRPATVKAVYATL